MKKAKFAGVIILIAILITSNVYASVPITELKNVSLVDKGDYYDMSQQIILFEPNTLHLQVFFRPEAGLPLTPEFKTIKVKF